MKVLVIGGGGREHALCASLSQSPRVDEIVCAPGNAGIALVEKVSRCIPVNPSDLGELIALVELERPGLTVVGPEIPLSLGLVDALRDLNYRAFGPTQSAAQLETSKAFAKEFMKRHDIPTADYAVCSNSADVAKALSLIHGRVVVKADGLAAGKGVVICESADEAKAIAEDFFSGRVLGTRASKLVIEEFLEGEELSLLCLTDGTHAAPLLAAQDHKRIGENDIGANTGGMGAYTTDSLLAPEMQQWVLEHIVQPTLDGMREEGSPFIGVLYCGLMMTALGPRVLEYNCRFGDPETEAILPRLDSDITEAFDACIDGRLSETELRWLPGASACVIAASFGYPGKYETGKPISGLDAAAEIPGVSIFHAGTALHNGQIVTAGGRVLAVSAVADALQPALDLCYRALAKITFDGIYFRRDIGHRALHPKGNKKDDPLRTDVL
jgi:phosphoribosylamine--glycine ligase